MDLAVDGSLEIDANGANDGATGKSDWHVLSASRAAFRSFAARCTHGSLDRKNVGRWAAAAAVLLCVGGLLTRHAIDRPLRYMRYARVWSPPSNVDVSALALNAAESSGIGPVAADDEGEINPTAVIPTVVLTPTESEPVPSHDLFATAEQPFFDLPVFADADLGR